MLLWYGYIFVSMHNYCGYWTHRLHFHLPLLMKILHPLVQLLVMLHTNWTWELSPKNKPTPLFLNEVVAKGVSLEVCPPIYAAVHAIIC